jgi:hypothetical protein
MMPGVMPSDDASALREAGGPTQPINRNRSAYQPAKARLGTYCLPDQSLRLQVRVG